jgi:hypothetical protein
MNSTAFGILLLVLAGAKNGSFTLPMKFTKNGPRKIPGWSGLFLHLEFSLPCLPS